MFRAPAECRSRPARTVLAVVVLAALVSLGAALAQPDLYGPDAPADVAFLRALNASAAPVEVAVGDTEPRTLAPGEGTEYVPLPSDAAAFSLRRGEGEPETISPQAGPESFVTLLVTAEGTRTLQDQVLRDISRGLLVFVNATDRPLSLLVEDGDVAFEDGGEEPASRTIAEAAVGFDVVDADGKVVGSVERRLFARGVAHTILAYEGPDGPAVSYLAASLAD